MARVVSGEGGSPFEPGQDPPRASAVLEKDALLKKPMFVVLVAIAATLIVVPVVWMTLLIMQGESPNPLVVAALSLLGPLGGVFAGSTFGTLGRRCVSVLLKRTNCSDRLEVGLLESLSKAA
ncbi:hypothetical protein [Arthrobacter sp. ISL-95]|uniref:hypothetical protein n=1 Tax=Arthrobacter sp. ISL-95 TaxID=2819116 RepID=UPI001BE98554|nr:hypothetical protein [Arthrobacter sp. ISL-95]MBT2585598.1 hypothetical protein [Arthrobacter sp. ISL-95]